MAEDPLELLALSGWRIVWLADLEGDVFVIDECRVVLADARLTRRAVADALWRDYAGQMVS